MKLLLTFVLLCAIGKVNAIHIKFLVNNSNQPATVHFNLGERKQINPGERVANLTGPWDAYIRFGQGGRQELANMWYDLISIKADGTIFLKANPTGPLGKSAPHAEKIS